MIEVEIDTSRLTRDLDRLARDQVPFAASRAVNAVAQDFQLEQRRSLRRAFVLRRPAFVEREAVKIGPWARKDRLEVHVGVSDRGGFMRKFEDQVVKRPRDGRSLAVPASVRRNKRDLVPKGQRPAALKADKKVFIVRDRGEGARAAHLDPGLYQRLGGRRKPRLRLLYALEPSVRIRPVLRFALTARRVAAERWPRHFVRELEAAIRTAR